MLRLRQLDTSSALNRCPNRGEGVVRVVGYCVCWREAVEIFVGFMCAVELVLIDSLRLQAWSVPLLSLIHI